MCFFFSLSFSQSYQSIFGSLYIKLVCYNNITPVEVRQIVIS